MSTKTEITPISQELIESKIYLIRDQKVMFDSDIAKFYGVETKKLNQAVNRNLDRFPEDFMFQITDEEWTSLEVTNCDLSKKSFGSRQYKPYAFTEQGVMMLASVLNSKKAIAVNIQIIRAFKALTEAVKVTKKPAPEMEMMLAVMGSMAQTIAMMQDSIAAVTDLVATLAKNQTRQPQQSEQAFTIPITQPEEKKYLSANQAAKHLGISNATATRWVLIGKLPGEIIQTNSGPQYRIPIEAVLQFQ